MTEDSRRVSTMRRWEIAAASLGAALAIGAVALALATALPPSLENLASGVSDGVTAVPIGDGAEVVVPAEWIVTGHATDGLAVRTPDGALRAQLETVKQDAAAVLAATPGVEGTPRSEQLASGMEASHAGLADGGYIAVVAGPDGGEVVRVVIEMRGGDIAAYRPAIGHLLEGIRA